MATSLGVRRYVDTAEGMPGQDVITYNPNEGATAEYQTKKPDALLERIVRVSSNKGDLVLDAFCG